MTKTSKDSRVTDLRGNDLISRMSLLAYESIEQAFPEVDPGLEPLGSRVLVQIRSPMEKTASGFVLPEQTRETEYWNTQVAKVIRLGPGAYKNRDSLETWPEGEWVQPGTFVRCPKYGGDRYEVPVPGSKDPARFVIFNDMDIIAKLTGDPLIAVAYIPTSPF